MNNNSNIVKENKKVVYYTVAGIIALAIVTLGLTYAYWILTKQQEGVNTVNTACLSVNILNEKDEIDLPSAYPISDEAGLELTPFKFTVKNNCSKKAEYSLNLEMLNATTLSSDFVRIAINEEDSVAYPVTLSSYDRYDKMKITGTKEGRYILSGVLQSNESKNYELRLWLASYVTPTDDANNKYYASKIVLDSKIESTTMSERRNCQTDPNGNECILLKNDSNTNSLLYDGTSDDNLRYTGANPNNYVRFNNEIWRIIGFMKVKTNAGKTETRLKIIRQDGIESQKDFGVYNWDSSVSSSSTSIISSFYNNWPKATLKNMLNGIYYESGTGQCFKTSLSATTCNFTGSGIEPKGLDSTAIEMIDSDIVWNLGGWKDTNLTAAEMYEKERGISTGNNNKNPQLWSKGSDPEHKGIGLMYPSDYGFAVGGEVRSNCLSETLYSWWNSISQTNECGTNDWLKPSTKTQLTISPQSATASHVLTVSTNGNVSQTMGLNGNMNGVWPVVYLKKNVKIVANETHDGSLEQPYDLSLN